MANPLLVAVRLLKNHGAEVCHVSTSRGRLVRFVPPDGFLSIPEAAKLLGTNRSMVRRMGAAGRLAIRPRGPKRVSLAECRLLMKLPRRMRLSTLPEGRRW